MKMNIIINNEALAKAHGVAKGDAIKIETKGGVPVEKVWRSRLNDAKIDNCVTLEKIAKKEVKK